MSIRAVDFAVVDEDTGTANRMITVLWGAATDPGQVRTLNEDSFLAQLPVFVVADGMGGHAAGEVASGLAIDEFRQFIGVDDLTVDDVAAALGRANAAIVSGASDGDDRLGMGTTAAGMVMVQAGGGQHWMVFNIGDSRVYRFAEGQLDQVSIDHSEVEELVAAGQISRTQARLHQRRNIVTRSLGTQPAPVADSWLLPPVAGERYLVCSDGLPTELDDPEIAAYLGGEWDAQTAARRLVERAVAVGGRDNVTVLVVDVVDDGLAAVDEDTVPRAQAFASASDGIREAADE
jgi:serine/threonine protein phosphatase PrpC